MDIGPEEDAYVNALEKSVRRLADAMGEEGRVLLLGSIASPKYLDPLARVLGRRLVFPRAFVGRGDMSRGGLLLPTVRARRELEYVVALDAERRGSRPPQL